MLNKKNKNTTLNYDIDFIINKSTLIKICLDINIKSLLCCQDTNIILLKDNKRYLLSVWPLRDNMNILKNALKKTLENQYQLHPSITEDIGYLYNQDIQDKGNLVYEYYTPTSEYESWVGDRYNLWNGDFTTWLYNDSYGNIILHFTPSFHGPWGDDDFDEKTHELAYAQWIANEYKPLWTIILPKKTARLWLRLAENIYSKLR